MKVFVIGVSNSGRTTLSKSLCDTLNYKYIDASGWLKSTFRSQKPGESIQHFQDEYHQYLSDRLKINPNLCIDNVLESVKANGNDNNFIIDGVFSPKDFANLFDFNTDMIVFLNRVDKDNDCKESENIAISVIRDFCFWMSACNLLPKPRWLEYNFKIPGEESDFVKELGSKNKLFIIRSLTKVIDHLKNYLETNDLS